MYCTKRRNSNFVQEFRSKSCFVTALGFAKTKFEILLQSTTHALFRLYALK